MNKLFIKIGCILQAIFRRIYNRGFGSESLQNSQITHVLNSGSVVFPNHPIEIGSRNVQFMGFEKDVLKNEKHTALEDIIEIEPFNPEIVCTQIENIRKFEFLFNKNYYKNPLDYTSLSHLHINTTIIFHLKNGRNYQVLGEWGSKNDLHNIKNFFSSNTPDDIELEGLEEIDNILVLLKQDHRGFILNMQIYITLTIIMIAIIYFINF